MARRFKWAQCLPAQIVAIFFKDVEHVDEKEEEDEDVEDDTGR